MLEFFAERGVSSDRISLIGYQNGPDYMATYGQIAELVGVWGAARQVGWALRRLPLPSEIPWQRVVNAKGQISFNPSREGSDWIQRELLLAEGIPVDAAGQLPLAQHRWRAGGGAGARDGDGVFIN